MCGSYSYFYCFNLMFGVLFAVWFSDCLVVLFFCLPCYVFFYEYRYGIFSFDEVLAKLSVIFQKTEREKMGLNIFINFYCR